MRRFVVTLLNHNTATVFADKTKQHAVVINSIYYKQRPIFLKDQQLTNYGFLLLTAVLLKNFNSLTIREDY